MNTDSEREAREVLSGIGVHYDGTKTDKDYLIVLKALQRAERRTREKMGLSILRVIDDTNGNMMQVKEAVYLAIRKEANDTSSMS